MAYQALASIAYKAIVTSTWLNQVVENFRVHEEYIAARRSLPHARVRALGGSVGTAAWTSVLLNTSPADGGTSDQTAWTISTQGVTINTTGLYLFTVATSMNGSDFAIRLVNTQPEPDVVLAQTLVGGVGASLTDNLSIGRRLVAGDFVAWQVYKATGPGSVTVDAAGTPCYLDVIRLSD